MSKKTINGKLKSLKTYQAQERALTAWAENWKSDQENVISQLRRAAMHDDHGTIMHMIDQLQGMTEKRFLALNNMAHIVSDPQRQLMDRPDDCPEDVMVDQEGDSIPDTSQAQKPEESLSERIVREYRQGKDIRPISDIYQISFNKVVKILVTAGIYHSEIYDKIQSMREAGITDEEICLSLKIKKSAMDKYTPYKKGIYLSDNPSENAFRIRKSRGNAKG